jgi:hypothetical protein
MDSWTWFEFNLKNIVRCRINANGSAPVSINHAGYDAYEVAICESQSLYLFFLFSDTANTSRSNIVNKDFTVKLAVAECIIDYRSDVCMKLRISYETRPSPTLLNGKKFKL